MNSLTRLSSQLIFQTSVRSLAFSELAEDPAIVKRLRALYDTLDTATTPTSVLFPWLPSPSAVRRLLATKRIYDIIGKTLDDRRKSGIARDDTPQMLIDAGDERMIIIGVSTASFPFSTRFSPCTFGSAPFFKSNLAIAVWPPDDAARRAAPR